MRMPGPPNGGAGVAEPAAGIRRLKDALDTAGAVADTIEDLAELTDDAATDAAASNMIGEAWNKLDGNHGGNGRLDKLEYGA